MDKHPIITIRWYFIPASILLLLFLKGDFYTETAKDFDIVDPLTTAGWIVFDSNRSGQFDIYKMKPDGSDVRRLTYSPKWDIYPDWSTDGRKITFARHRPGDTRGQGEICVIDSDGDNFKVVARDGTFPQFTQGEEGIIFERDRRKVMFHDLRTGVEKRLFPPPDTQSFKYQIVKPRLSADGQNVVFTTDKRGQWNLWSMSLNGSSRLIFSGCEGTWDFTGTKILFIAGSQWTGTSIWTTDWPEGSPREYLSLTGRYRHVYFPSMSSDGKYLLFSACPAGQHDHFSANYQIFIMPVKNGGPVRITRNRFTDRWPRLNIEAQ